MCAVTIKYILQCAVMTKDSLRWWLKSLLCAVMIKYILQCAVMTKDSLQCTSDTKTKWITMSSNVRKSTYEHMCPAKFRISLRAQNFNCILNIHNLSVLVQHVLRTNTIWYGQNLQSHIQIGLVGMLYRDWLHEQSCLSMYCLFMG